MAQPVRSMMAMLGFIGAVRPGPLMRPRMLLNHGSRILLTILLVAQMLGASACVLLIGAAGGAGGTVYVMGKLKEDLNAPVPKVKRAVVARLKDLGLPVLKDKGDQLTASLESEFADGKHVWIEIEARDESSSQIAIRVGLLGDEQRSRRVLKAIRQHL